MKQKLSIEQNLLTASKFSLPSSTAIRAEVSSDDKNSEVKNHSVVSGQTIDMRQGL